MCMHTHTSHIDMHILTKLHPYVFTRHTHLHIVGHVHFTIDTLNSYKQIYTYSYAHIRTKTLKRGASTSFIEHSK